MQANLHRQSMSPGGFWMNPKRKYRCGPHSAMKMPTQAAVHLGDQTGCDFRGEFCIAQILKTIVIRSIQVCENDFAVPTLR